MTNGWDNSFNEESVSFEDRMRAEMARRMQEEETRRARRGYIELAGLSQNQIVENFQYYAGEPDIEAYRFAWTVNKNIWMCHNCGCFGFKYDRIAELFKCYSCRSRNVTVCKAGQLSLLIREAVLPPGVNMDNVYANRRVRLANNRRNRRNGTNDSPVLTGSADPARSS